jgi:hypothetical protein
MNGNDNEESMWDFIKGDWGVCFREGYEYVICDADPGNYIQSCHGYKHDYGCWSVIVVPCSPEEVSVIQQTGAQQRTWRDTFGIPLVKSAMKNSVTFAVPLVKSAKKKLVFEPKKEKQATKRVKKTIKPELKRPMPHYLVTRIVQRDDIWSYDSMNIWQLNHPESAVFEYDELTSNQQEKVEKMFKNIMQTEMGKMVQFSVADNDCLEAFGEGGENCGPYGTDGLTELDYVLEKISIRLSKDDTLVNRIFTAPAQTSFDVFTPMDLVNGKFAFLEFIE